MSLQKYSALVKTVELGSITQAAEQMGYTQPAVSRMIADLEKQWGVELLRRSRGGFAPSAACLQLMPILRTILADCEELDFTLSEIHGALRGLVRVGIFTSVADMWIPRLLRSFRQKYPNIEFDLQNMESYAQIEKAIRHGEIDCGFVRLPTVQDLEAHFLMRDQLVAVLPPEHPMKDEPVFPVARLESEAFIQLREKVDLEVAHFLEQIPHAPKPCYEVSSDHTALSMVEQGLGITITHSLIAGNPRYRVICKPFDRGQHRDIAIATAKNVRVAGTTKLFVQHVISEISPKV